jgi:cell division protein FtsB
MHKFLIAAVMATSTVALAAPAAAQWAQPQGYGYNNNYGQVRSLQVRINNLERHIARLDNRDRLSEREARRLRYEANVLERRLRSAAYNGLSYREAQDLNYRLSRLEQRVRYEVRDGNRRPGWNPGWNGGSYYDRDRDGLDDRYERDRGTNYDEDRDPD